MPKTKNQTMVHLEERCIQSIHNTNNFVSLGKLHWIEDHLTKMSRKLQNALCKPHLILTFHESMIQLALWSIDVMADPKLLHYHPVIIISLFMESSLHLWSLKWKMQITNTSMEIVKAQPFMKFKMPSKDSYSGNIDPIDHVSCFDSTISLFTSSNTVNLLLFTHLKEIPPR